MATENNDLGPRKGETADQFKERIFEVQREAKRAEAQAAKPATAASTAVQDPPLAAAQVNAPAPKVGTPPSPTNAPQGVVTGNAEVDDWLGKKGFKSTEDFAQSYRELERELHRKAQQPPTPPAPIPAPPSYPPYTPAAPSFYQAPPVQYAPQYMPPAPVNVAALARQYGLDPADFEKVAGVANDLAQSAVRAELARVMPPLLARVQGVDREVTRQRELVNLMSEPTFKNPQVQYEMHRVLEEDPSIFDKQVQPVRFAHDQALMRIARANLGNPYSPQGAPNPAPVPNSAPQNRPPAMAGGNGNGGGGAPNGAAGEEINPATFAKMSLAEKADYLRSIGAR